MHYNIKDLTGLRFGRLIVKSILSKRLSDNRIAWLCQCDCGKTVEKASTYLKNIKNGTHSCGCAKSLNRIINVPIGTKNGKLTVIAKAKVKISPNGDKHTMIKCQCDCGKTVEINSAGFRNNKYLSCGKKICKRQITNNEMITNKVYKDYKSKAKERGYSFNLTKDFFSNLIFKNCNYCNKQPSNTYIQSGGGINKDNSEYKYNGVDRVNNSIGYEINNVVTCCKTCNIMKMTLSETEFIDHITIILKNLGKI